MCVYVCICVYVCVCVCVSNTTKIKKDYIFKLSFFFWLETGGFSETWKSLIVNVYFECLRGPSMLLPLQDEILPWFEKTKRKKRRKEKKNGSYAGNSIMMKASRIAVKPQGDILDRRHFVITAWQTSINGVGSYFRCYP